MPGRRDKRHHGGFNSARTGPKMPSLPINLLKELGVPEPQGTRERRGGPSRRSTDTLTRKEVRSQKKALRKASSRGHGHRLEEEEEEGDHGGHGERSQPGPVQRSSLPKGNSGKQVPSRRQRVTAKQQSESDHDASSLEEISDAESTPQEPVVSRTVRERLAQDDAEVAALERKLGLTKRKTLPKSFEEDGLGFLLGDIDGGSASPERTKRKAEDDAWLAKKRRKGAASPSGVLDDDQSDTSGSEESDFEDFDQQNLGSSLSDASESPDEEDLASGADDEFLSDFSGSDEPSSSKVSRDRVRENPYAPPTVGVSVAKYVPPSRRKQDDSDKELAWRVRRQAQGLINRLTEANLLGIVGDCERLWREHPRQIVTSTVIELLLVQICEPTSMPDTLLILIGGFAAALYRVIGTDFGASLLERVVESFQGHYQRASTSSSDVSAIPKETSNLITFLTELYSLQVVGPNIVFDYIRMLLGDLSELNAELLLRIVRMCGPLLRQDDPLALKDVVSMIRQTVDRVGEQQLSARTKFMIEAINDLKNNKQKTGASASAVVAEHRTRIRKLLGSLGPGRVKASEPLGVGLADILNSDKKGKWWLVGASWEGRSARDNGGAQPSALTDDEDDNRSEDSAFFGAGDGAALNVSTLARENGMNTDVRRSIFSAIVSATDYEDAYARLLRLRLNKDRQREIPTVVLQCTGAEHEYNPYYTLIAGRLCSDRKFRWAFRDTVWKLFRRLGESLFGEEAEEETDDADVGAGAVSMRRVVNIGKMLGSLIASGSLSLALLKCLNLALVQPKTKALIEVMFITVLLRQDGRQSEEGAATGKKHALSEIFGPDLAEHGGPELLRGMQWFLRKVVSKSDLVGSKAESHKLRKACRLAELELRDLLQREEEGLGLETI